MPKLFSSDFTHLYFSSLLLVELSFGLPIARKKLFLDTSSTSKWKLSTPNFSLQNIPFPSECQVVLFFTDKIADFIKRIRWITFFFYYPGMKDRKQNIILKHCKSQ